MTLNVHPDFLASSHVRDQPDKLQISNREHNEENEGSSGKGNEGANIHAKAGGNALEALTGVANANNDTDQ